MIKDKILYFGHGDITTKSNFLARSISFQNSVEDNGGNHEIYFYISYIDYPELKKKLNDVLNKEIDEFEFKEFIFNFKDANEHSIQELFNHFDNAMGNYVLCSQI